ncbi:MAG: winged helix-turn-helix transcriptional regulator [Phycisphaerales bacterium]|jgi:DNA-binding transcriptional ArsR family regulator|nr:winged helix-turn-helix transcriptional regulator [Phycisphaerales bacterium]
MNAEDKRIYKLKAEVLSAAGHPIRLAIIDFLGDGEQCVCDIADHVDAQRSNVSRHLGVLLNAGVVKQRKDGLKMIYSLSTPCILNFMKCVEGVLQVRAKEAAVLLEML